MCAFGFDFDFDFEMRAAKLPIRSLLRSVVLVLLATTSFGVNVTYDHRAIVIDGKRRVLVSGSIHYPRSTPDMWPDLIQKSKDGGLDVIETYVFWNLHEPVRNKINTCNGFYCDQFTPNSNTKPKMWTENWSGWFLYFGGATPYRPVEDLAFAVARFYQRGGTFQNYYMYHGGTNFGRTTGGPFIATSYDYDAPIDEYGIPRQPKWGHLKDVHKAIKLCEKALVATDPTFTSLGPNLEATVYKTGSGLCAAFLANVGTSDVTVNFSGNSYCLPAWSVSILPDCKNVVLNTAKINSMTMIPSLSHQALNVDADSTEAIGSGWSWINEPVGAGITGPVKLKGSKNGNSVDLSSQQWTYQIGLKGEDSGLSTGSSSQWVSQPDLPKNQPLIWYKTKFDAPAGNDPVALDFTGMGKGEAWINGQSIGRYWPTYISPKSGCTDSCNYRADYNPDKCKKNCGKPSQELYHVPRSWLQPSGNTLVLFEEIGGDPTQLAFATKQTGSLCSHVSESHPSPVDMWGSESKTGTKPGPTLSLACPFPDQAISSIKFASFGTPSGTCGGFSHGKCSSPKALSILQKACIGSKSCSIAVSTGTFGDPCRGVIKSLAVEASCT
ncbi:hypothetical protein SLEP1_g37823 [Rubroshorea leprosula]|uniref:beta-galactosidase n=1 Tax=Rubroshorea leprosula TaxID=152421 RepID=A0AAV5KVZ2_9ROSI|nr:hypothetical protein SLEP1_g37823 [Rubroshorea leprosula]